MLKINYIFLICSILLLQGCVFRTITDYDNCVPNDLVFEFKDKYQRYIIDDSKTSNKYSAMNLPQGEYFISSDQACSEDVNCTKVTTSFRLTGKMKYSSPKALLSVFVESSRAVQIDINGTKAWIGMFSLSSIYYFKEHTRKDAEELSRIYRFSKRRWHESECPNDDSSITDWNIIRMK